MDLDKMWWLEEVSPNVGGKVPSWAEYCCLTRGGVGQAGRKVVCTRSC